MNLPQVLKRPCSIIRTGMRRVIRKSGIRPKTQGKGQRQSPVHGTHRDGLPQDMGNSGVKGPIDPGKCWDYLWPKISPDLPKHITKKSTNIPRYQDEAAVQQNSKWKVSHSKEWMDKSLQTYLALLGKFRSLSINSHKRIFIIPTTMDDMISLDSGSQHWPSCLSLVETPLPCVHKGISSSLLQDGVAFTWTLSSQACILLHIPSMGRRIT